MVNAEIVKAYKEKVKTIELHSLIKKNKQFFISGLSGSLNVIVPLSVSSLDSNNHCFVLSDKDSALSFYSGLCEFLAKEKIFFFPYSFIEPYDDVLINNANVVMRTETIQSIETFNDEKIYIVTYPEGLFELYPKERVSKKHKIILKKNQSLQLDALIEKITEEGFIKNDYVTEPGDFSLRGNILDIYSFSNNKPIRIELDGDIIERIKVFDVESQLTISELIEVSVVFAGQTKKSSDESYLSLFEYFKDEWTLWFDDINLSANIIDKKYKKAQETYGKNIEKGGVFLKLSPEKIFFDKSAFLKKTKAFKTIEFFASGHPKKIPGIKYNSSPQPKFNKSLSLLADDLKKLILEEYSVFISFQSEEQSERLALYFDSIGFNLEYSSIITKLSHGFVDHENKLVYYTDHEIFNRFFKHAFVPNISKKQKNAIKNKSELEIGDYVVHIDYGVGRFVGMERMIVSGTEREVVRLVYKNNDVVLLNINSLHKIAKYSGSGGAPHLSNLNTQEWVNKKKKIKSKIADMAKDLIHLYLKRREAIGFTFEKDSFLQIELESSFLYQDTPDQTKTTQDVKKDMESSYPMDRLVCGDVGFGKTEIAIRAAFKAICSNKQVLILVPTTILAYQHYNTFKKRLENFPVSVDYLSRFRSTKEKKQTLNKLAIGELDIIIGTHSVLSKNVIFKNLGLLIVDEEQKFGVALKEKIKKQKLNLDCLTLTATPIPRTLHFSLIGVRDISIIRTPPVNRQAVHTEVLTFSEKDIRDIINNEMSRFGQVFFVHNRVENIYEIANIIQKLIPNAKVAVAHGQQKGDTLEKTILGFIEGRFDVLVSTNIIESGLDIPNANTIIINQAHMFGLSDLHQMRGRVGRSNKKAFCRLLVPSTSNLNIDAKKRLMALEEFSNLGDGLNIALKDLDIRGAGNLLGGEQSGFINDLGFETYNKILDEALNEVDLPEKNNKIIEFSFGDCLVDLYEKAFIPEEYVSNSTERLRLYGFIEEKTKKGELNDILHVFEDRFGSPPKELLTLLSVMKIKKIGSSIGVDKIQIKETQVVFTFINGEKKAEKKQSSFLFLLNELNKKVGQTKIKERGSQISISVKNLSSASDVEDFLNKLSKKTQ